MASSIELSEFFVEGKRSDLSHVLLHITEPATPEERKKGYFFALAEIEQGTREDIEDLQHIIEEIESGYYHMSDTPEKSAFELALEYANRKGGQLTKSVADRRIHCVVGTVIDTQLTFSYRGDVHALIFYQGQEGIERINILEQHQKETEEQLFPSTLDGALGEHDAIFIGTPFVTDHFSYDRLEKLLSSRAPRESADHIQKVLQDVANEQSYGGIIFHVSTNAVSPRTGKPLPKHTQGSVSSLNNLITAQQQTEETLSPPLLKGMQARLKDRWQKDAEPAPHQANRKQLHKTTNDARERTSGPETNYRRPNQPQESLVNKLLILVGRGLVQAGLGIVTALKYLFFALGRAGIILIILITNKNNSRKEILDRVKDRWEYRKRAVRKMSLLSKIILLIITLFALLFVGSILFLKAKERREARERAYTVLVQEITDLKEQADAKLVYNDTEKALSLLQTAETKIAALPRDTEEQQAQITTLTSDIETILNRLRKQEVVTPTRIVDIKSSHPEAALKQVNLLGDTLIAYGPQDKQLYLIQRSTEQLTTIPHDVLPTLTGSALAKEVNMLMFLTGPTTIAGFSFENNTVTPKDIASPNANSTYTAIEIYNDKLYTLDPTNNQIYKHSRTLTGFDKGTPWVQDADARLQDTVSLTIDGDVYVLRNNGEVFKFNRGTLQPFTLGAVDPALSQPTKISTYTDTEKLYILEPINKRIVVYSKDGKFIKQLTAIEWQEPTDMIVDPEKKLIYVLDQQKLYSIPLL